jgi:hypothetical protein
MERKRGEKNGMSVETYKGTDQELWKAILDKDKYLCRNCKNRFKCLTSNRCLGFWLVRQKNVIVNDVTIGVANLNSSPTHVDIKFSIKINKRTHLVSGYVFAHTFGKESVERLKNIDCPITMESIIIK